MSESDLLKLIKADLSVNYNPLNNDDEDNILLDIIQDMIIIAKGTSHQENIDNLIPYIKTATKSAYLRRGKEGETSNNEGSQNYNYEDIIDKLKKDIVQCGQRRLS